MLESSQPGLSQMRPTPNALPCGTDLALAESGLRCVMPRVRAPLLAFLFAAALAAVFAACASDSPTSLEERAQSIDRTLICPVCPGETIDQAQVELARQMRTVVREKLAEGMTRDEVLQFFVDRYGESVLAAPPKDGFNLIAWVVPIVAVVVGVAVVALVVRGHADQRAAHGSGRVPP